MERSLSTLEAGPLGSLPSFRSLMTFPTRLSRARAITSAYSLSIPRRAVVRPYVIESNRLKKTGHGRGGSRRTELASITP